MKKIIATTLVALTAGISVANAQTGATFSNSEIWQKLHQSIEQKGFKWTGIEKNYLNYDGSSNTLFNNLNQNLIQHGGISVVGKDLYKYSDFANLGLYDKLMNVFEKMYGTNPIVNKTSSEIFSFFADKHKTTLEKEYILVNFLKEVDDFYFNSPKIPSSDKDAVTLIAFVYYLDYVYWFDNIGSFAEKYNINFLKTFYNKIKNLKYNEIAFVSSTDFDNIFYINSWEALDYEIDFDLYDKYGSQIDDEDYLISFSSKYDIFEIKDWKLYLKKWTKIKEWEIYDFSVIFTPKKGWKAYISNYKLKSVWLVEFNWLVTWTNGLISTLFGNINVDTNIIPVWKKLDYIVWVTPIYLYDFFFSYPEELTTIQKEELDFKSDKLEKNYRDFIINNIHNK